MLAHGAPFYYNRATLAQTYNHDKLGTLLRAGFCARGYDHGSCLAALAYLDRRSPRLKGSSATQLPGAPRGLRVVQAASGSASHLEATAGPRKATKTAVLGSEGRLQLATVVSMATPAAPLSPSTGTTLSAQYITHDSK